MDSGAPTVGIAILNVDSGPGTEEQDVFANQTALTEKEGISVLGYVYTDYGNRPVEQVEADTRRYFDWYHVNGIFYDEAASTSAKIYYYKQLYAYTKSLSSTSVIAINPGTQTVEAYMTVCDIECNFEGDYDDYENSYTAPAWIGKYSASRFWQIVYDVPTETEMLNVVALAKKRNAGWVFVTTQTLPNPYNTLPQDPYWSDELSAVGRAN